METQALVRRAQGGDREAADHLFRSYFGQIRAVVTSRFPQSADIDDLIQATFVRAYLGLGGYRGDASFGTWLTRIAMNVCSSHVRRCKAGIRRVTTTFDEDDDFGGLASLAPDQEHRAWIGELRDIIEQGMESLPAQYQEVLRRYHFEEQSFERICGELQIPVGTLKTWLHRSRRRLGETLRKRLAD